MPGAECGIGDISFSLAGLESNICDDYLPLQVRAAISRRSGLLDDGDSASFSAPCAYDGFQQ